MDISSVLNTTSTTPVTAATSEPTSAQNARPIGALGDATAVEVSKPGELFGKLQQLLQQDPAKFKEVASGIAESLRSAAQQAGGRGADFLGRLADKFDQAAQAGNLSPFQPRQPASGEAVSGHHHHGGQHGGGGGGGIESALQSALDQVNQALTGTSQPDATGASTETT